jgi:hypothetical protein
VSITIEGVTFNGGDAYTRVTYRGVTLNKRTAAAVIQAQRLFGQPFDAIPQGSYHSTTQQSAGTHDGGGAIDIFDGDLDKVQRVMRTVGFAAWHRPFLAGPNGWNPHCHAIMLGDKEMSDGARAQIPDYRNYLDGLASHAADPTWHPFDKGNDPTPVFDYPKWLEENFVPFPFSDEIPATDGKQIGEALREALRGDEHFAAIQANVNAFQAAVNGRLDEQTKAIKDQAADFDKKLDDILAALKP